VVNVDSENMQHSRNAEDPPAMNRPLGPTESIYYLLDQLYCLNFVVFAEIGGRLDLDGLNHALHTVQQEKPLLRARIALVRGRHTFQPIALGRAPLQARVAPLRDWRARVTEQLSIPFDGEVPLARCFWFCGRGDKSVVAIVLHHVIADGKSGANTLLEVLRRAGGEDLPFRLQAAHACAQDLDPIQHKGMLGGAVQKLGFWLGQGKAALKPSLQLPGYDMQLQTKRTIRAIAHTVPKVTTQALLAACRAHGTTMHGALAAAQLLAINSEFDSAVPRRLAVTSLAACAQS
jgi:hypothetical protein